MHLQETKTLERFKTCISAAVVVSLEPAPQRVSGSRDKTSVAGSSIPSRQLANSKINYVGAILKRVVGFGGRFGIASEHVVGFGKISLPVSMSQHTLILTHSIPVLFILFQIASFE